MTRGALLQSMHVLYEVAYFLASLVSRTINAVCYQGSMHQTLSARTFYEVQYDHRWERRYKRINATFRVLTFGYQRNHCADAWDAEVSRARKTLMRNGDLE